MNLDEYSIPGEKAYLEEYCRRLGKPPIQAWDFYTSFICFRFAAILQGVYKRATKGKGDLCQVWPPGGNE